MNCDRNKILNQDFLKWELLLLFLFFSVSFLISLSSFVGVFDEGILTYGAQQVLQGAVPYRDFGASYGPAEFYVLAFLFKVFGPSLLIERLWSQIVFALLLLFSPFNS